MKKLTLYTTLGCHLCEQALAIIKPLSARYVIDLVDIADSEKLMALYGVRIPVVKREDNGEEIGWPFDTEQFVAFLNA